MSMFISGIGMRACLLVVVARTGHIHEHVY